MTNTKRNRLTGRQTALLTLWVSKQNVATRKTYDQIAKDAENELQFKISGSNIKNLWVTLHGNRVAPKSKPENVGSQLRLLRERIAVLEDKVSLLLDSDHTKTFVQGVFNED